MGDELFTLFAKLTLDTTEFDKKTQDSTEKASVFGDVLKADLVGKGISAAIDGVKRLGAGMVDLTKKAVGGYAEYEQLSGGISKLFGTAGQSLEEYAEQQGLAVDDVKDKYNSLQEAQDTVMANAAKAYETAGMSANDYMEAVSGFSAALVNSLGGDTVEAANRADVAMRAISDNVNTFGTDIGSVQTAFQGFAKQNYTMLDNLKLGYGGTKTEMERLIDDANAYAEANGQAANLSIDSFADIVSAIELIQEKQGIAKTTSEEASKTIEGSLNAMKAAWDNLIEGIANPDADIGELLMTLVDTADTALDNILPAAERAIEGIGEAVMQLAPVVIEKLPEIAGEIMTAGQEALTNILDGIFSMMSEIQIPFPIGDILNGLVEMIQQNVPIVVSAVSGIISTVGSAISQQLPNLLSYVLPLIESLSETIRTNAGTMVDVGIEFILNLAQGIMNSLPTLLAQLPQIVINIAGVINDNAPKLLVAGVKLIAMIIKGLVDSIPALIENFPKIFEAILAVWSALNWMSLGKNVINFIRNGIKTLATQIPNTVKSIGESAVNFFKNIQWTDAGIRAMELIKEAISSLASDIPNKFIEIGNSAVSAFKDIDWFDLGANVIRGIVSGISSNVREIADAARAAARNALNAAKNFLGIQSPSKVFRREVGEMIPRGMALGIEDTADKVDEAISKLNRDMFNGLDRTVEYSPTIETVTNGTFKPEASRNITNTFNISVDGTESPEAYANRLVRELELQMRTA